MGCRQIRSTEETDADEGEADIKKEHTANTVCITYYTCVHPSIPSVSAAGQNGAGPSTVATQEHSVGERNKTVPRHTA